MPATVRSPASVVTVAETLVLKSPADSLFVSSSVIPRSRATAAAFTRFTSSTASASSPAANAPVTSPVFFFAASPRNASRTPFTPASPVIWLSSAPSR